MDTSDITVQILRDIRDSIGTTNTTLDGVRTELDGVRTELDAMRSELGDRIDTTNARLEQMESHLGTAVVALRTEVIAVRGVLEGRRELHRRIERCERDIVTLKQRVPEPQR